MSPEELSEKCQIGLKQARDTINKTTQRITCSAVTPLSRKYKTYRVFQTKRITGMCYIDTMDGQVKWLDGNRYAQVFSNETYFTEISPIANKYDAGKSLKMFVMELGAPEELTVNGYKEHNIPGTEFMNFFQSNEI